MTNNLVIPYLVLGIILYVILARLKVFSLADGIANIFTSKPKTDNKNIDVMHMLNGDFWSLDYWKKSPANKRFSFARARELAEKIKNTFGFFNDDEMALFGIFANDVRNKTHISQIATYYYEDFGKRLDTVLAAKLSNNELYKLAEIINKLPD